MKLLYHYVFCLSISLLIFSCSGTTNIKGGMGHDVGDMSYGEYQPQNLGMKNIYEGVTFHLDLSRVDQMSPIEPSMDFIKNAFINELSDNGALISDTPAESNIIYRIVFSKYITKKLARAIDNNKYQAYLDCHLEAINAISNAQIESRSISLSGLGQKASIANNRVLEKLIKKILLNKKLTYFAKNNIKTSNNFLQRQLDLLAKKIYIDFNKLDFPYENEIRIAFTGFKNDDNASYSNLFQTSLQKIWTRPKFRFYSRTQLDKILEEYKLNLSGILEEQRYELGSLKTVDLFITGSVSNIENRHFVEVQIIQLKDGEIIISNSAAVSE